jgi:hypothetical protein
MMNGVYLSVCINENAGGYWAMLEKALDERESVSLDSEEWRSSKIVFKT